MNEGPFLLVFGAVIGAVLASVITALFLRKEHASRLAMAQAGLTERLIELEGQARSAEARAEERRREAGEKEEELRLTRIELAQARESRARLEESERHLGEEIGRLQAIENKLGDTFKVLSHDALARNTEEFRKYADEFMKLAEEKLRTQTVEGKRELEGKKELIDRSIEEIGRTVSEVQRKIEEVAKAGGERFAEVATLIREHEKATNRLKDTTDRLGHALSSARKRGEWGERMAEDIIRLVGMREGVNYIRQKTLESAQGRPDYTFLLPNDLKINMDVKFPMDNYMHFLNAESDHDRRRYRDELVKNARAMIRQVTTREYIDPAGHTVDYVIVFIPNEQVYGFINESDAALMDDALKQKVILCSPFTLYAVLAVVRQAIENFNLERTASEILRLLAEFSKQWVSFREKFRLMGERLDAARKEYDVLSTTRSAMLERPLKKIDELRKQSALGLDEEMTLNETA